MTNEERDRATVATIERQILSYGLEKNTLTGDDLDHLKALLDAHGTALRRAKAGPPSMRVIAEQSAGVVAAVLTSEVGRVILQRFAALMPIAGTDGSHRSAGEANTTEYAEAVAALFAWEAAVGPDARMRASIRTCLAAIVETCRSRIDGYLQVRDDEDVPDVRLLARDILRLEAIEWAIAIAGGAGQAEGVRALAHRAARQAVTWAGKVFERFRARPDELSHFDAIATLSAVDDLLVVILRVLDGERDDRRAGSNPFVLNLGEQALRDFAVGLEHMTGRYLGIAERHLLASGTTGDFVLSVLSVLQRILHLGQALMPSVDLPGVRSNHEMILRRMVAMRTALRASLEIAGAPVAHRARLAVLNAALVDIGV